MKKIFFATIVALMLLVVPTTPASAAKPKNGQKFKSTTMYELTGIKNGYWKVFVDGESGKTVYWPTCKNNKGQEVRFSEMYLKIGKRTYWVNKSGYLSKNNPDGYKVSKSLYIIFPGNWVPGSKPSNGEKFTSKSFKEMTGIEAGYWKVDKTGIKPGVVVNGFFTRTESCYVDIGGYTYYIDEEGCISSSNPDNYTVHENGYVIPGSTEKSDNKASDKTSDKASDKTSNKSSTYTIKKNGDNYICVDEKGNWVTGFVEDRYFTSWGGMAIGLMCVENEYYYFSDDIDNIGKMLKNTWKNNMYFGSDGKALRSQKATIDGKTYYFNDSGFLATGYVNGEFYSSEPDRYGQLVPGISK